MVLLGFASSAPMGKMIYFGKKARMKIARKMEVFRRFVSNGI